MIIIIYKTILASGTLVTIFFFSIPTWNPNSSGFQIPVVLASYVIQSPLYLLTLKYIWLVGRQCSRIWILWKQICDQNFVLALLATIKKCQNNFLNSSWPYSFERFCQNTFCFWGDLWFGFSNLIRYRSFMFFSNMATYSSTFPVTLLGGRGGSTFNYWPDICFWIVKSKLNVGVNVVLVIWHRRGWPNLKNGKLTIQR